MDNADLEKLKISPGRLVPKFNSAITEYSVTVGSNIQEIKLSTLTSDGGASCIIKGDATNKTVQLTEGTTSVVEIVVTAEDGQTNKTYTISIKRLSSSDACLSQLDVSAGTLQPVFSPSTLVYYCDLPANLTSLSLKHKTEDPGMKMSSKDGSPLSSVSLSPGLTVIEILVTSPNGTVTTTYTINAVKLPCPYPINLTNTNNHQKFTCTACAGLLHCPCAIKGNSTGVYCQKCLLELSRINKVDPLSGESLGEGWMIIDHKLDSELSTQQARCVTPFGSVEGTISEIPLLISQQKKQEEVTDSCTECSKKVPKGLFDLHKQLTCSSKLSETLPKTEVKELNWQKRYYDVSLPSDIEAVLRKANEWEQKYITALKTHDSAHSSSADILEPLFAAASCYATAISIKSKDSRGHVGLGLVMEEVFYVKDLYGHKPVESSDEDTESEAERTSKEEEFLAICELHGVSNKANVALQLKAVEKEFHSLKEAGQTHRAEQVQLLYQWMSKKLLQENKGSYAVESESPLFKAKIKFEHAVSVAPTDHSGLYHLGRLSLLLGETNTAGTCLKAAASIKPTHSETLLCLGQVLSSTNPVQAKPLILFGLTTYLQHKEQEALGLETTPEEFLHGTNFWRPTNTLIGEALLTLANLGGHGFLNPHSCLLLATRLFSLTPRLQKGSTLQQLLWLLLRGRSSLLNEALKEKSSHASDLCQQISALIVHCQLPLTELLRAMQMKIFEDGVMLQPCNSTSLCHLGNGQLQQFEATGDKTWLELAEKSFRASISCEGKPVGGTEPPTQIKEQDWWIKRLGKCEPEKEQLQSTVKQIPPKGKAVQPPVNKGKQPVSVSSSATKGGTQRGTKQPPAPAKVNPVGRGRGATPVAGTKSTPAGGRGKTVATLGDLKSGSQKTTTSNKAVTSDTSIEKQSPPAATANEPASIEPAKLNDISYQPRLGLARTLSKLDTKNISECTSLYKEVFKMAPSVHDAYIELGELLAKTDPLGAVQVYSLFPFTDPPSFDDAYLHGEIVRLLMSNELYDDPRLCTSMIAMGRALGIAVLDKHVSKLEAKFKTSLLKDVYAGVHGKSVDNPDLQAFLNSSAGYKLCNHIVLVICISYNAHLVYFFEYLR